MKTFAATNSWKALIASGLVANGLGLAIWLLTYSPRPIAGVFDGVTRLVRLVVNRSA